MAKTQTATATATLEAQTATQTTVAPAANTQHNGQAPNVALCGHEGCTNRVDMDPRGGNGKKCRSCLTASTLQHAAKMVQFADSANQPGLVVLLDAANAAYKGILDQLAAGERIPFTAYWQPLGAARDVITASQDDQKASFAPRALALWNQYSVIAIGDGQYVRGNFRAAADLWLIFVSIDVPVELEGSDFLVLPEPLRQEIEEAVKNPRRRFNLGTVRNKLADLESFVTRQTNDIALSQARSAVRRAR